MTNRIHYSDLFIRMSLLMLIALLASPALQAKQIDIGKATSIAEDFFSSKNHGKAFKAKSVDSANGLSNPVAENAYFVFTPENAKGFVIVSAEDEMAPIVGYSLSANYDPAKMPPALAAYLSDYSKVVKAISDGQIEYKTQTRGGTAVAPLMTVQWNQGDPYNLLTPEFSNGNAPTGCVATAMAQVMKYYQCPPRGNGSVECAYGSVELGHDYDWAIMLDNYYAEPYSEEQANAVAVLMRDIGYSVKMMYGRNESSAFSAIIGPAMCNHFNYSPDITYAIRSGYSTQAWIDEIRESLLRQEPILYSGSDGQAGHQFVCDGIDTDDMVHINWGWSGYGDGFFDINILSPDYLGTGAGNGAYYRNQDMVLNIRPGDPDADYLSKRFPLTLSNLSVNATVDENGKLTDTSNVSVKVEYYNSTGAPLDWDNGLMLGIALNNSQGDLIGIFGPKRVYALGIDQYMIDYFSFPLNNLKENGLMADGNYSFSVVCIPYNDDNNYQPSKDDILPLTSGDLNNIGFSVIDGEVYLDKPEFADFPPSQSVKLIDAKTVGQQYAGMNSISLSLTIQNTGSHLIENGYYTLHLVPIAEDNDGISAEFLTNGAPYHLGSIRSAYIYPDVALEMENTFNINGLGAGKYRLYVTYTNSDYKDVLMDSDNPIYIDILEMPTNDIFLRKPIKNWWPEAPRYYSPWVNIEFTCYSTMDEFETEFQIWCHKKGDDASREFLLYKEGNKRVIKPGEQDIEIWGWGEDAAIWFEEIGTELEACIKYADANGNLKPISGSDNLFNIKVVEDDSEIRFNCVSPMVINGGKPVEAKDGTTFDVEFEISTNTDVTFQPSYCSMYVTKDCRQAINPLVSFNTYNMNFEKNELAAGEKTKVTATIQYAKASADGDLFGKTLYVMPRYFCIPQEDYFVGYNVQMMPYLESTAFTLVAPSKTVENISLSDNSLNLKVGDTHKLVATVLPEDAVNKSLVWSSSDESVATVSNEGLVTALKLGQAEIKATAADGSGISASCKVTVIATTVTSIAFDKTEWSGKVGETMQLSATVLPADATNKSIVWSSSDESVATVSSEGLVTAKKVGQAEIKATAADGSGISASCKVTVIATTVTSISLDKTEWSGKVGETMQLSATVLPADATNKSIVWSSSDESVATVSSEGSVTAKKVGQAEIKATASDGSGISATCKVTVIATTVTSISLDKTEWSSKVGETIQLSATVLPADATNKSLVWTSSDESVATVSSEGLVTAKKVGQAEIKATAADGSGSSATCKVTVIATTVSSIAFDKTEWSGKVGETMQLSATVLPADATNKSLVWSSSDESVATVSSEGSVTAKKVGQAEIKATAADGSGSSATCKVTVIATTVSSIAFDKTEWSGKVGETMQLSATVLPADATNKSLVWSSSDESVATVSSEGLVTAKKVGQAEIKATAADGSGISASCKVTVIATTVTSISLDKTEWSGKVGETMQLSATVLPADATNKSIVWSSSDESVATVSSEGLVTALNIGEAEIKATAADGSGISASCKVTVIATTVTSISLDKTEWSGKVGETMQLSATVLPADATNKSLVWSSSDESVATVSSEGLVTAKKVGQAEIKATAADGSGISASCKVTVIATTVTSISLDKAEWSGKVGETMQLSATVLPADATNKSIVWSSSDESVATVSSEGLVTAKKVGQAEIKATATDGSGISASCKVTVMPILVESLSISPEKWDGTQGKTFQINVTIMPENATDPSVEYSSSDDSIAQVSQDGLVSVLSVGNCKIMVSTVDGSNLTAECIITSASGIEDLISDDDTTWNVWDTNGTLLKKDCDKNDLKLLTPGIYILQTGIKITKIVIH